MSRPFPEIAELAELIADRVCPASPVDPEAIAREEGISWRYGNYGDGFDGLLAHLQELRERAMTPWGRDEVDEAIQSLQAKIEARMRRGGREARFLEGSGVAAERQIPPRLGS